MRKGLIVTLLALGLLVTGSLADATRIPLTGETNQLEILSERGDALHFRAEVGSMEALEVSTKEGVFTRLSIPGFHFSNTEGAPQLPQMNRLYEIPFGASTRVEIISSESQRVKLSDYGIDARLMPAQPSMPKSADAATWPFVYDRDSYNVARVAQPLVDTRSMGRLRAVDLGLMEFSPVEYMPASGELVVHTAVEFVLHFDGADRAAGIDLKASTYSPFFEPVYGQIAGYRSEHTDHPDLVRDVVTMVVLTPPEFESAMQPFVDWKTERGFNVIVGVTGTPEVGSTTNSIHGYIEDLYYNGTPTSPAPSFVVFVGDVAQMPTYQVSGDPTDRPYCDIEGDLVPDIYYGRLSATNTTQLNNILEKTLMYDQFTMPDPSYLGEVVMIAGMDSYWAQTHANGQINYGTTYYFNAAHGITSHTYLYPASGSSDAQIVQDVSNGVSYVNYTAHGSQTSWSDPTFTQSNINSLQNYGEYCLAVGNCCLTSTYDYGECFAETWLRAADKGAIGYIGGSNSTYWDEDYYWGVGYGSTVANPTYETHGQGVYDGLFHDHEEAWEQWYVCNDAIIFCGNLAVMESGSSRITYYWNIYNLMGDPSISTYLGVPSANNVSHDAFISGTATEFEVQGAMGSYVGLTQDGVLAGAGTIGPSGVADIAVWNLSPTGGDMQIVVMAQNREPYTALVPVGYVEQPEIVTAPAAFDVTLYQSGSTSEVLEIGNVGETNSVLEYVVSVVDPNLRGERSVAGSTLTPNPTDYTPGATETYTLTVYNNSGDSEWLSEITLDFATGVNVVSSTNFSGGSAGDLVTNGATGDGANLVWSDPDGGWGQVYGGESATASVTLQFTGGMMGDLDIPFTITGDIYGADPHSISGDMTLTGPSGPSITLIAPDGGETWGIGDSERVLWSWTDDIPLVDIELSRNGGMTWEPLVTNLPNLGSWSWSVTGPDGNTNRIRVSTPDDAYSDTSAANFTIYQPLTWVQVPVTEGTVSDGDTDYLNVNFDAAGLAAGDYEAEIHIEHNAPGDDVVIPVILHVTQGGTSAEEIPAIMLLRGNYPNPFNPKTTIRFSLPSAGEVNLVVFDVKGRQVATLIDGSMDAGDHHVVWDGQNDAGQSQPSGLYFYTLDTGDEKATRKMLMLK